MDTAAAAQTDGQQIRHTKVSAHAPNLYRHSRLAGKALVQDADVCGGAADVNDNRLSELTQVCSAADAVRRPRRDGEDGILQRIVYGHQAAIVLAKEQGCGNLQLTNRALEAFDSCPRHSDQRRVQHGGVLPLQQAHAADLTG